MIEVEGKVAHGMTSAVCAEHLPRCGHSDASPACTQLRQPAKRLLAELLWHDASGHEAPSEEHALSLDLSLEDLSLEDLRRLPPTPVYT